MQDVARLRWRVHRFGAYALDTDDYQLTGPDGAVDVEPQVFDVLAHLVERAGELVTKEQLLDEVWGDRFVSESAMTSRISAARRAVGDDGRRQDVIQTVHGRGYRFIAEVDGTDLVGSPIDGRPVTAEPGPGSSVATGAADATGVAPPAWPQPRLLPSELRPDNRRLFVGRQDEVDLALRITDVEGRDRPSVLWLLGEPGIGKTRLAAKIAHLAPRHRDPRFCSGGAPRS